MEGKSLRLEKLKINKSTGNIKVDIKEPSNKDIAIIGIGIKLPKANNLKQFWYILENGIDLVRELPEERRIDTEKYLKYNRSYNKDIQYLKGAFLEDIDKFDFKFFKMTPKEASLMSPIQRLFLETAWNAIEDAGYGGRKLASTNTGVYLGLISDVEGYKYKQMLANVEELSMLQLAMSGNLCSIAPSRISYILDLKGPSMLVDTACSSSLVSLHVACQAIRNGECDQALAGGIRINILPYDDQVKIGIESSDGITRTFDDNSDGTGIGEGVVAILLKPLNQAIRDHDNIYAVIKGSAVNQDGNSMGITAPNAIAQGKVIEKAWKESGIDPQTISYIEAHGTGTKLGDPIEIEGITRAFKQHTSKKQFCAIGSVKSNIGHLYEAAGLAGLVKCVLMFQNKRLLQNMNFNFPNQKINFEQSPVYLCNKLQEWETDGFPRRCGVSSFGFSGTNCHVILEEAPKVEEKVKSEGKPRIFTISAKSKESLIELIRAYELLCKESKNIDITNLCYTAATGRGHFNYRLAFITNSQKDFKQKIAELEKNKFGEFINEDMFYCDNTIMEITDEQKDRYTTQISQFICDHISTGSNSSEKLREICKLYIKGLDIKWEALYRQEETYKISIPTYPFEKKRCWLNIPEVQNEITALTDENLFYGIGWKKEDLNFNYDESIDKESVLIFKDNRGLSDTIAGIFKQKGADVIEVQYGVDYEKKDNFCYTVGNVQEHYDGLIKEIKHKNIIKIIFMSTVGNFTEIENIKELDHKLDCGVFSLLYLVKAIHNASMSEGMELTLVSDYVYEINNQQKRICPENAPLLGLGKVISKEYPNISCKCIDIDDATKASEVLNEVYYSEKYQVVYRNGSRYVQELSSVDFDKCEPLEVHFKYDGVYIITGGAGGIGLEIAKYLAFKSKANIALINRTNMPEASSWDAILKENSNSKISKRIKGIKDIEALGSKVMYYNADIQDIAAIEGVVKELRKDFGKINGVFHCAGIARNDYIINQDQKYVREVLSPKVHGSWILDKVTQKDRLDFFVLFSSIASIFSAPGQCSYSAANAYQDSFSSFRNKEGRKTLVINWVAWKETGMAVDHMASIDTIFKAIINRKAIIAFDQVINKNISQVIIGALNFEDSKIELLDKYSFKLSKELQTNLQNAKINLQSKKTNIKHKRKLETKSNDYSEIEKIVEDICKNMLGFDEIDVEESFFDMGADSITLTSIHEKVNKQFPGKVTIPQMFGSPTIARISQDIFEKTQNKQQEILEKDEVKVQNYDSELDMLLERLESGDMDIEEAINNMDKLI
ncbi:MAG: hypothetical protein CVV02_12580 [Firmicutes bacterium HGW-Firmicutes-7]|nr:MAG: hypothetical protein CVV02_12580 [Firmicutes bacterium HGW-Firmicutes-7]